MAGFQAITGRLFNIMIDTRELGVIHFHLFPAILTDDMVMIVIGDFIDQLAAADMRRQGKAVLLEEFQRAINGGFGQPRQGKARQRIHLGGGQVFSGVLQDLQHDQPLGGQAETG